MQLAITAEAKEEIAKKVHCLVRSPQHYKEIFDRVNLYMPFIERIIQEEGLPEDFKYLAIQESRLVADEVSTSNAVGFWQMKHAGATESGVRIDQYIDERMHVVAATRGFARYVKSHHAHFKNWLYALLAFHLGRTGVKPHIDERYLGAKFMEIDQHTHFYIYHFLAHKLVFQDVIGKELHPEICLYECHTCQGKSLKELSQQFGVSQQLLRAYNKWLKPSKVPEDATCPVLIPLTHQQYAQIDAVRVQGILDKYKINYAAYWDKAEPFPVVTRSAMKLGKESQLVTCFNGITGAVAQAGDSLTKLAEKGCLSLKQFLAINELTEKHRVQVGQVYYFKRKRSKADVHYHIVRPGETWWSIAQKYGITKSALLSKNRLRQEPTLEPGRVLWLRFIRPADIPIAYEKHPDTNAAPPVKK
jgi:membrane-bound lytic murein transglycosylase D